MTMNRHRTITAVAAARLCAVLVSLYFLSTPLHGQQATRTTPSYTSRPTLPGGTAGGLPRRLTPSRARGITNIGTYLRRPHWLIRRNAFSARIPSRGAMSSMQNPLSKPRQADVDRTLETMMSANTENSPGYADLMLGHIAIRRRQAMADGWAHFHKADYVRALAAFDSAAMVAPNDPTASFGQFMCVVASRHHRRAMHKLINLARYDQARPAGVAGMFEFDFSLTDAFVSDNALTAVLDGLREFAQANPDRPPVQALHCFVLWYTRSNDAVIEARSMAARIERTHPASAWARFHRMIQAADSQAIAEGTQTSPHAR